MAIGTLKKWIDDRGFGFLKPDDGGPDVFLHRSHVLGSGIDPATLREGDRLLFDVGVGRNDKPAATNVQFAE